MSIKIAYPHNSAMPAFFLLISLVIHAGLMILLPKIKTAGRSAGRFIPVDVVTMPVALPGILNGSPAVAHKYAAPAINTAKGNLRTESATPGQVARHVVRPVARSVDRHAISKSNESGVSGQNKDYAARQAHDATLNNNSSNIAAANQTDATVADNAEISTPSDREGRDTAVPATHTEPNLQGLYEESPVSIFPTKERLSQLDKKYMVESETAETGRNQRQTNIKPNISSRAGDNYSVTLGRELSFQSDDPAFGEYLTKLKNRVYAKWEYPDAAVRAGQEGRLLMKIVILKDGGLGEVRLIKSSAYPILDNAAISAVRLAAPFYLFPDGFGTIENIVIDASFEYNIIYRTPSQERP